MRGVNGVPHSGIDRGSADVAVVRLELLVEVGESRRHDDVDPAQEVVLWDAVVEVELVEEPALIPPLPPHHRAVSVADSDQTTESPFGRHLNAFIDSIGHNRTKPLMFLAAPLQMWGLSAMQLVPNKREDPPHRVTCDRSYNDKRYRCCNLEGADDVWQVNHVRPKNEIY